VSRLADALRRRPRLNILAFTLTVLIAVGALQAADLAWRREHVLKAGETRATNLAFVLAEYIRGSFTSADAALRQLQLHGARVGGPRAPRTEWESILASAEAALPESGSLSVTDDNGIITYSTLPDIVGQSRAENYVFKQLAASATDDLAIDRPYEALGAPGTFILPVARRLTNDAGRFAGIIVAVVVPERYRKFFQTIDVGHEGNITVLHLDGVVLFREPSETNPINEPAPDHPLLKMAQTRDTGVVRGRLTAGGPRFVTAYRKIGNPPLLVAISLSEAGVLSDWYAQRRISAIAYGALTVTLGLIVAALFHVVSARQRVEQKLAEMQRVEAERLRTANERLEAALEREQQARKATEEASYLKDEFLMTVSHELRTPLTAIYGWARVLGTKEMPKEDQRRALSAIERNAHAQTRLIDDLLDVSRAISGKLRLEMRKVKVADVLNAAIETVNPAMAAKHIRFDAQFDPDTPTIAGDPDRLQQVVWNLLSNAIKFTPEGGTVRLRLRRAGSLVEIEISDSGDGITPEFLPHVFERFRQADTGSRRRYGGLGLGLAIVRHIVELHGGTVTAESDGEGKGSTFRVPLPIAVADAERSVNSQRHNSATPN
jgi:signal transduction histidine kinase